METRVNERRIQIPVDSRLRDDLASIQRIVTPQGLVKFIAARTSDGHADRATALALAQNAAEQCPCPDLYSLTDIGSGRMEARHSR